MHNKIVSEDWRVATFARQHGGYGCTVPKHIAHCTYSTLTSTKTQSTRGTETPRHRDSGVRADTGISRGSTRRHVDGELDGLATDANRGDDTTLRIACVELALVHQPHLEDLVNGIIDLNLGTLLKHLHRGAACLRESLDSTHWTRTTENLGGARERGKSAIVRARVRVRARAYAEE